MSLEKSQKIVKVLGILSIIGAVASFIVALGMFGLGGSGAANMAANDDNAATGVAVVIVLGVVMLVEGVVSLVQGVFSLQAAKDATKATPPLDHLHHRRGAGRAQCDRQLHKQRRTGRPHQDILSYHQLLHLLSGQQHQEARQ